MSEFLTICPRGGGSGEAIVIQRFTKCELRRTSIPRLEQMLLDVCRDRDIAKGYSSPYGTPEVVLARKRKRFDGKEGFYRSSLVEEILRTQDLLASMCK